MSYILDALRKAEAQRQRGTVPGLHTPPLGEGPGTGDAGPAGPQRWAKSQMAVATVMGAVGLAVLVALAVGWRPGTALNAPKAPTRELRAELEPQATGSHAPAVAAGPGAAGAAAPPASPTPPTATPPPVALPVAPITALPGAAVVPSEGRPRAVPAPATADPAPMAQSPDAATPPSPGLEQAARPNPTRGAKPAAVAAAASAPTSQASLVLGGGALGGYAAPTAPTPAGPPTAPSAAAATEPRVYKPAELPPEIRQQLPSMTVGGAMHSENAASRMLILNGQLYREGEQPAPGVTLERIQLRSAVLVFKGWRYEIAY